MWYKIKNEADVFTPSVLIYPDRIDENIRRMIKIAGDVSRLRPHVKTHKMAEVVQLQVQQKITKFKCATLTEMEMTAANGGTDILLAYPLLGPDIKKYFSIVTKFPQVKFSVLVDHKQTAADLTEEAKKQQQKVNVFIDIDNGMHRTGIEPEPAFQLAQTISKKPWLELTGLHIYDGHIHVSDLKTRETKCENDFKSVDELIQKLKNTGIEMGELACGGTFTFPIHAKYKNRTLCPGTPILWDAGYKKNIPDLDFLNAAVLAGRVISKPYGKVCFDLGHKAMASEMPHPRLEFMDLLVNGVENQSEEHLVLSTPNTEKLNPGDFIYAIPIHICPTIALHEQVYVVENRKAVKTWDVIARKRTFNF
ncbi:D-TA family PLP-dependent enzyme [Maribellus comscasis]|uniref:D-TA family PLP-dependent enzyme n=1 Tax=Maribellus comscasis TaxID=2681766 RepID=A0A6I6JUY7_9BACT|nr:D-TA family PLP-dependent enzyme [Maribellus comscasis]QGY44900.1 D-TA family PLP-dependent enzyme [Maribellus comscasis]